MTIIDDLMKLAREIGDVSSRTESVDPGIATCLAAAAEIRELREQLARYLHGDERMNEPGLAEKP